MHIRYAMGVAFLTIFGVIGGVILSSHQALDSVSTLVLMGAGAAAFLVAAYLLYTGWQMRP